MSVHRLIAPYLLAALGAVATTAANAADAALIEAAKKERQVVWYTTLIVNQAIRPLKEAFEKKYPGMDLQYVRADESPTAAKLLGEANAGRVQADLFDGISNMIPLKRAGHRIGSHDGACVRPGDPRGRQGRHLPFERRIAIWPHRGDPDLQD